MGKKLIKGGAILSMDSAIGTMRQGDILIDDARIVEVGRRIEAGDCEVFDATGMVVMPGLVDAHRHLWYAGIRGGNMDSTFNDIMSDQWGKLGPAFEPGDVYAFTRAGIADCLDNGVTTVFDWCHIINSPAHAEAAIAAHKSMGMRAVFGYGGSMLPGASVDAETSRWSHAEELLGREFGQAKDRLTMALALQGLDYSSLDDTTEDVATAREWGLPMSFHVGVPMGEAPKRSIRRLADAGLLGPDMSFAHCCDISDDEVRLAVSAGAHLLSCPGGDAAVGIGSTPTPRMRRNGARPCFCTDSVIATTGDLFEQARIGLLLDRYEDALATFAEGAPIASMEGRMTTHEALEAVTTTAAAGCWLDADVGSLTPGKQADVLLLRATDLNLWPMSNLEPALLAGAHGGNVDTVLVAGEVVKREGQLVGVDLDAVRADLTSARDRLYSASSFNDVVPSPEGRPPDNRKS